MNARSPLQGNRRVSVSGLSDWVAVLGGATIYDEKQICAAYQIGQALARKGKNILTGATTGIPYAAAIGAREAGALVVGMSPAGGPSEHLKVFRKPLDQHDLIVYSGAGVEGRGPLIVRSAAACIFIGGEFGTLNEFTAAWMVGRKILGVLKGSGGITDAIPSLIARTKSTWGSVVVYDENPKSLVAKVCREIEASVPPAPEADVGHKVRAIVAQFRNKRSAKS